MFAKWVTASAAAVLGCTLSFSSPAQAAPKELTGLDANGNTVDSGWSWDVSAAQAPFVNLVFIKTSGNQFFFEKDAQFQNITTPVTITFTKTATSGAKDLVIADEVLANKTGSDWTSFTFSLASTSQGSAPGFAFATSDGKAGLGDFNINPFTAFSFQSNNSTLNVSGGTVPNGSTFFPGAQSTTGLAIVASGSDSNFNLVEQPGGGGQVIPLPAAAWSGLTTLLGLGLLGAGKRLRQALR